MSKIFHDFDLSDFWENKPYAIKEYVCEMLTDEMVKSLEDELGYRLPLAYIELMRFQNGGIPKNNSYRVKEQLPWAGDYISIYGIFGISRSKAYSLGGRLGSKFMIEEWGYPPIGVYFCDTDSAGHDMVCLDYRACGLQGEPCVVHIDQEFDYKITFVAENFETFIRGLETIIPSI